MRLQPWQTNQRRLTARISPPLYDNEDTPFICDGTLDWIPTSALCVHWCPNRSTTCSGRGQQRTCTWRAWLNSFNCDSKSYLDRARGINNYAPLFRPPHISRRNSSKIGPCPIQVRHILISLYLEWKQKPKTKKKKKTPHALLRPMSGYNSNQ